MNGGQEMKIIEGLKGIQEFQRKAEDLRKKISDHSAHLSHENPPYPDQKKQVSEWLQAHSDVLKHILRLRLAIQRTNLATEVEIELDGKGVSKSIAEWIHRRRDLAKQEAAAWSGLTDRQLSGGVLKPSVGEEVVVTVVRCFDPAERDKKRDLYGSEPLAIDAKLEVANAVTDLLEIPLYRG